MECSGDVLVLTKEEEDSKTIFLQSIFFEKLYSRKKRM
jgi:hypothetical protein